MFWRASTKGPSWSNPQCKFTNKKSRFQAFTLVGTVSERAWKRWKELGLFPE